MAEPAGSNPPIRKQVSGLSGVPEGKELFVGTYPFAQELRRMGVPAQAPQVSAQT